MRWCSGCGVSDTGNTCETSAAMGNDRRGNGPVQSTVRIGELHAFAVEAWCHVVSVCALVETFAVLGWNQRSNLSESLLMTLPIDVDSRMSLSCYAERCEALLLSQGAAWANRTS